MIHINKMIGGLTEEGNTRVIAKFITDRFVLLESEPLRPFDEEHVHIDRIVIDDGTGKDVTTFLIESMRDDETIQILFSVQEEGPEECFPGEYKHHSAYVCFATVDKSFLQDCFNEKKKNLVLSMVEDAITMHIILQYKHISYVELRNRSVYTTFFSGYERKI